MQGQSAVLAGRTLIVRGGGHLFEFGLCHPGICDSKYSRPGDFGVSHIQVMGPQTLRVGGDGGWIDLCLKYLSTSIWDAAATTPSDFKFKSAAM